MPHPVYVARERECGCVTGLRSDNGSATVADDVAEFIRTGRIVERVDYDTYYNEIRHEPHFFNCPHEDQ